MEPSQLLEQILDRLRPYEFRTLLIGFERKGGYVREEHEAVFRRVKIAIGNELERRFPGARIDFERPDIRIDISSDAGPVIRPAPIFLAGRYRKLSRRISASRWVHHACRGRGCRACSHRGTVSGPSIEELLREPVLRLSGGKRAFFHGMGREDVDARMLGAGRPFVLEVQRPVRRTLPLAAISEEFHSRAAGTAEVAGLAHVDRAAVGAVKGTEPEKTYRAWVAADGDLPPDAEARAVSLGGATVDQLSPTRVMRRRGETTSRRRVVQASVWREEPDGRHAWDVRVEAGTYVKELVSGDGGRTRPSLSEVLGVPCRCEALDVLEIHWVAPWEA